MRLHLLFTFYFRLLTRSCFARAVGEYSHRDEAEGVTHGGVLRSKNVGTSNHNAGEKPARRKTKVSLAMIVSQGLVGPKRMVKTERDGHRVNIP